MRLALLDLPAEAVPVLTAVPYRSGLPTVIPTDPTIYRLYEALQVYGPALKELTTSMETPALSSVAWAWRSWWMSISTPAASQ
jgi:cyanate lyase